jgi:hypothetical protein
MTQIPPRSSSKYAGQYARGTDVHRLIEIFNDSNRIALGSKNPDTATDRFHLAVEAFHQIMGLAPDPATLRSVEGTMSRLAEMFPIQVVVNESLGLREKAAKLKTPKKKLELLRRACDVIEVCLSKYPGNPLLKSALNEVRWDGERSGGTAS